LIQHFQKDAPILFFLNGSFKTKLSFLIFEKVSHRTLHSHGNCRKGPFTDEVQFGWKIMPLLHLLPGCFPVEDQQEPLMN
jgi:hypothetical protein